MKNLNFLISDFQNYSGVSSKNMKHLDMIQSPNLCEQNRNLNLEICSKQNYLEPFFEIIANKEKKTI